MGWLADVFGSLIQWAGVPVNTRAWVNYDGAVTVTDNPVEQRTDIYVGGSGVSATFGAVTAASLTIGPTEVYSGRATSTGNDGVFLLSAPLNSNSTATMDFRVTGNDGTYGLAAASGSPTVGSITAVSTLGGAGALLGPSSITVQGFPLAPSLGLSWVSLVNSLLLSVTGPQATVTGSAAAGSPHAGKLELTLSSTSSPVVTAAIAGVGLTVSGLTGTPLGNAAHAGSEVVYVDASHIILTDTTWVANDTAGLVVETIPRVIAWSSRLDLTIAP